jgi:hypothetical protein
MGSVLELDCKHVGRNFQIGWSGLEKLDSGIELDSETEWKKDLKIKDSKE